MTGANCELKKNAPNSIWNSIQVILIFLLLAKVGHMSRQKRVDANDGFLLVGWFVLLMFIRRQRRGLEFAGAEDLDDEAFGHLNCMLNELYNSDTLTIPGNVKINGQLEVDGGGGVRTSNMYCRYIHCNNTDNWVEFSGTNVQVSGGKNLKLATLHEQGGDLEVEGHTRLLKGLQLPGIESYPISHGEVKPAGEGRQGWVYKGSSYANLGIRN
jgi:hypothetical protein